MRYLLILALFLPCSAQNGGVVPPPDIVGAAGQIGNAGQNAQQRAAQTQQIKQQTELLKAQTELLKLENAKRAAELAAAKNLWHLKDQSTNQVMIECNAGTHPEVFTKGAVANLVCATDEKQ